MTPSQDPGNVAERFRMAFEELGPDPEYPGLDLKDATDRLITFANWPLQSPSKEKLSEAGFYYISKGDIVKCAYCQVKIGRWEPSDDPEVEHRKYSSPSKCLFLLWSKSTTPDNYTADGKTILFSLLLIFLVANFSKPNRISVEWDRKLVLE